jgi:cyclopropane fatty-acyl-phospholipid synthase-like methyltransferase
VAGYDEDYRRTKDHFGTEPDPLLCRFLSVMPRNQPVLDIGAGQGRNALYLARQGFSVVAIDPSRVGVDMIAKAATKEELPITTHHCGFDTFTPHNGKFGGILLFGIIQVLSRESIQLLTRRIDEWLHPGGCAFITAFTTADAGYARYAAQWKATGENSFANEDGEVHTYLKPGEILTLLPAYEVVHHWEGTGPDHRHGEGEVHRHEWAEAVFRRPLAGQEKP